MSHIAEKIAKLIAKADSTTHEAEAETFMAKAHALLEAHGLSMLDLGTIGEDPVGRDDNVIHFFAAEGWCSRMLFKLAIYYGCELVQFKRGNKTTATVFGRESARVTFTLMAPFVMRQVRQKARKLAKEEGTSESRAKTALGNAMTFRLQDLIAAQQQRPEYQATGVNALVPVDVIKETIQEAFPTSKKQRAANLRTSLAAMAAAETVSLNRQTSASPKAKRITA